MQSYKFLLITIFSFGSLFAVAQKKTEFVKVSGNCNMCKTRIEKAAKAAGASTALWNVDTDLLTVSYNTSSTSLSAIESKVASAGHDTKNKTASKAVYSKLHGCCRYERTLATKATATSCCTSGASCCLDGGACCTKAGSAAAATAEDCCAAGANCCKASKNCCNKTSVARNASLKNCCTTGATCCIKGQDCCSKSSVQTSSKNCCNAGADCCSKTVKTNTASKDCCVEGARCCVGSGTCCTKDSISA